MGLCGIGGGTPCGSWISRVTTFLFFTLLIYNPLLEIEGFSRKRVYPHMSRIKHLNIGNRSVGDPLILTPLLESGHVEEAQRLSRVTELVPEVTSYSGYFTVNPKYNSNMFFWYFPATVSVQI